MFHYSLRANEVQLLQIELRIVQYLRMETIGEAVKKSREKEHSQVLRCFSNHFNLLLNFLGATAHINA